MPQFIDPDHLARRRIVVTRIAEDIAFKLVFGSIEPSGAKQRIMELRRIGEIDDDETEGLLSRLGLAAS